MEVSSRRRSSTVIASVVLVFSLSVSPLAWAAPQRERGIDLPTNIVRIIKKIQRIFTISTHDDYPVPPKP